MSRRVADRITAASGLAIAAIGLATLGGWLTGRRPLAGFGTAFIPMAPNTAIDFFLVGLALAATAGGRRDRWRLAAAGAAAGAVGLLATVRLAEYVLSVDLGVDAWFLRVPTERLGLAPVGKMALSTALTFELASLAVLGLASRRRAFRDAAGLLGLATAASGTLFALGYLYSAPLLYGGRWIPMALNTSIAFLLLGTGVVAAAGPEAFPLRVLAGSSVRARLLRAFLPFSLGLVLVSDWLMLTIGRLAPPTALAIATAAMEVVAGAIASALCAVLADRIGGQLDRAEEELRAANERLETRVRDRTRDLEAAKGLLEERNRQLQEAADELRRTAESVREAHQELQEAHEDLKRAEAQLVETERLSSLGQVVAGFAHEINNPLAFVTNNVAVLQRDVGHLHELIRLYQEAEGTLERHQHELLDRIRDLAEQIDLTYVLEHVPSLMSRSREGLRRIQQIVKDLRDFARLDEAELKEADLNQGIGPTLSILRSVAAEKSVALVEDLEPLPTILCYPAKINQVVLNLVTNAIDACGADDAVTVSTRPRADGAGVVLEVADTGEGIEPSIRGRIFDPFFTTKPIGQGTGLGLAITYGIVSSHGGTIEVESSPGVGSRFTVRLPDRPPIPASRPIAPVGVPSAAAPPVPG